MKLRLLLILFLVAGISAVWAAEDLGELAKKEKARREALEKEGKKVKVFTNDDIDKLKAQIAIESGTATEDETAAATEESQSAESTESAGSEESSETATDYSSDYSSESTSSESTSDRQVNNQELQDLKDQREQAQRELEEARKTIGDGGLLHTRNVGDQFDRVGEAQRKLEEINARIRELEKKSNE